MLGFRKSMQDVVYLQHIALVGPPPDFTEGPHLERLCYLDGVITFDPPGFGMRVRDPSLPRRQSHDRVHIGARLRRHQDVVDMKPVDDGREHGVSGGKAPEQEGSTPAEGRACMRPRGFDACDVCANLVTEGNRLDRPAEGRWACLRERHPPCMAV